MATKIIRGETYMEKDPFQLISEFRKSFTSVQVIEELSIFITSSVTAYLLLNQSIDIMCVCVCFCA